jgi:hypothetical protein
VVVVVPTGVDVVVLLVPPEVVVVTGTGEAVVGSVEGEAVVVVVVVVVVLVAGAGPDVGGLTAWARAALVGTADTATSAASPTTMARVRVG